MKVVGRNWITMEEVEFPETLYKYRTWHNPDSPLHDNVLLKNEMYIPSPNEFEDIRDCRNPIRYDKLSDDELLELCSLRLRDMHPRFNEVTIMRMAEDLSGNHNLRDTTWLAKFEEDSFRQECELRGVLSVTSNPTRVEMWEKYGDEGKGICYGFEPHQLIVDAGLGSGGLVDYDDLPEISPFDDLEAQIFKRIYCKEKHWSFEEEYRLGKFGRFNRVQQFRNATLTEVILGLNFPADGIDEIIELLRSKGSSADLFQCMNQNDILTRHQIGY